MLQKCSVVVQMETVVIIMSDIDYTRSIKCGMGIVPLFPLRTFSFDRVIILLCSQDLLVGCNCSKLELYRMTMKRCVDG